MLSDLDHPAPENPHLDPLRFMVADYFATGEGRTVSILITTMNPKRGEGGEWEREPDWIFGTQDDPGGYRPGKLNCTPREILAREFRDEFGPWLATGLEFTDWDTMKAKYGAYLPPILDERIEKRDCVLNFKTQIHLNFS